MDDRPVGIFDSGLGGLTTVRELRRLLPGESIVYFGDTGRVPYGTRGRETVRRYAGQDIRFLLSKGVKIVVAACNTASATLLQEDIAALPVPYVDAVTPTVKAAAAATRNGKIAVIGTPATIKSRAYEKTLSALHAEFQVTGVPCALFVPLVENGFVFTEQGRDIVRLTAVEYLAPVLKSGADTLIMGCTHYPILRDFIAELVGPDVTLVDSGREAAHAARSLLEEAGLENRTKRAPEQKYYVSDSAEEFAGMASVILGEKTHGDAEQIDIDRF